MATLAAISINDATWALLGVAPLTFSVESGAVRIATGASAPTDPAIMGHSYSDGAGNTISTGPNVYAKSKGGVSIISVTLP